MPMRAALSAQALTSGKRPSPCRDGRQMEEAGGCPDPDAAVPYRCGRCRWTQALSQGRRNVWLHGKRIYTDVFGAYDIDALTGSLEAFDLSL